ncbi:GNAT family N-acetyltransferase [Streptomyces sp. NPDC048111]|uniref:GNAT family N-acetyltransferase n=1 Tax=Streptomyces sp. NPDC048111 TaxID=3365500 RepID=UPI0037145834
MVPGPRAAGCLTPGRRTGHRRIDNDPRSFSFAEDDHHVRTAAPTAYGRGCPHRVRTRTETAAGPAADPASSCTGSTRCPAGPSGGPRSSGYAGLSRGRPPGWYLGYWLHPAATGQGIATRATAAMVSEAFTLPDVAYLEIAHDAANASSGAVPRRLGFAEVRREQVTPPAAPSDSGIDVVWRLNRPCTER